MSLKRKCVDQPLQDFFRPAPTPVEISRTAASTDVVLNSCFVGTPLYPSGLSKAHSVFETVICF